MDLSPATNCNAIVQQAIATLGHIDVLVNNAGNDKVFLLSVKAGHITGQHLLVDGGDVHLDRALT
jgi:L-fucose dehydrogenase